VKQDWQVAQLGVHHEHHLEIVRYPACARPGVQHEKATKRENEGHDGEDVETREKLHYPIVG
jgi:hypothetical protein